MNTCDTCSHWQWPYGDDGERHLCCHPSVGSREVPFRDGAKIENRGDATGIITGPKFGCVHWEALK